MADDERQEDRYHQVRMISLGMLSAGMVDEIQTPLSFVASMLQSLSRSAERLHKFFTLFSSLEKKLPEELRELARKEKIDSTFRNLPDLIALCTEATIRAKKIAADVQSFAEPDPAAWIDVDINQRVESALQLAWSFLKSKTEVVREYGDLPSVKGHPASLGFMLVQILCHAAAGLKDKGAISVRTEASACGKVIIRIADSGPGMTQEALARLFEPGERSDAILPCPGMGLAWARRIVLDHGGDLRVESRPDQGTLFHIELAIYPPECQG